MWWSALVLRFSFKQLGGGLGVQFVVFWFVDNNSTHIIFLKYTQSEILCTNELHIHYIYCVIIKGVNWLVHFTLPTKTHGVYIAIIVQPN
jgi:hypothetical protein